MQAYYEQEKYDKALDVSKRLMDICSFSPALLYYTGLNLEMTGDFDNAMLYFQKATDSTVSLDATPDLAKQIWYKRYEMENPESAQASIEQKNDIITLMTEQIESLEKTNAKLMNEGSIGHYRSVMWTGIGIGIAGLILSGTGTGLAVSQKNNYLEVNSIHKLVMKNGYIAGWTLLGTGIGLTVAGTIVASIAGHRYSKAKSEVKNSVSISPYGASFNMTF